MHYRAAHHHQNQTHNQETDQRLLPFRVPLLSALVTKTMRSTSGTPTPTTMPDNDTPEKTKDKPKEGLSTRFLVLVVLSLQNSLFTVLRRYSQGVLKETYSKYELLLLGEIIKIAFSAYIILQQQDAVTSSSSSSPESGNSAAGGVRHFKYLIEQSGKMVGLAAIYGAMNILSFVSLRNIGAGLFTIFAQTKILTTAVFSTMLLGRAYSSTQWRALVALSLGVLLFSEPVWNAPDNKTDTSDVGNVVVGVGAVLVEVTLSGFASIYFEKVIKTDPLQLNIWERNFQLALVCCFSVPSLPC
jgi:solute carrier family 35 (UDP-sugar transporter), member A1/2/3